MWIKTKWPPVFNQNHRFKGITLVNLITFNQIKSFSAQFLYADSRTHSSSKSESTCDSLIWIKTKWTPKPL